MKALYMVLALAWPGSCALAQGLSSMGGELTIRSGSVQVGGELSISGGKLVNNGKLLLKGNLVNSQPMGAGTGTLIFNGAVLQSVNGTNAFRAGKVTINNPAGLSLNSPLIVDTLLTFTSGVLQAPVAAAPLRIGSSGAVSAVSNLSYVDGYVVKEGTGSFVYPVGSAGRYQPVAVNLTTNSAGMRVRYVAGDAGSAPFGTTGASSSALESYNNQEYWDISPVGDATGRVTIYWDDFKNPSITAASDPDVFSVAHLKGGSWLNEGSTTTGTMLAGNVTSAVVSNWSSFTLGARSSVLPVSLVSFKASSVENVALLEWKTSSEFNVSHFEVERSYDARAYQRIGKVSAAGHSSGLLKYNFTDTGFKTHHQTVYYRLRSVDLDGSFSFTQALPLRIKDEVYATRVYPNPTSKSNTITIESDASLGQVNLSDLTGRKITGFTSHIGDGFIKVNLNGVASGMYLLQVPTSRGVVSHKLVVE